MEEDKAPGSQEMRLAFRVSYLGDSFLGSQIQAAGRTVEGGFIAACMRLSLFDDWREARFASAGRTDRGVHSRGQVFAFSTGFPERAIEALNWQLPPDCWCSGFMQVSDSFHPRYDAKSRTYRYYFARKGLDGEAMDRACRAFIGTRDYSGYARPGGRNPVRTVLSARVSAEEDGFTVFEVKAESFLWHQVRRMAAALLLVGTGESSEDTIEEGFTTGFIKKPWSAPPSGLVLWEVDCGIEFRPMEYPPKAGAHLTREEEHHSVMKKICERLQETLPRGSP